MNSLLLLDFQNKSPQMDSDIRRLSLEKTEKSLLAVLSQIIYASGHSPLKFNGKSKSGRKEHCFISHSLNLPILQLWLLPRNWAFYLWTSGSWHAQASSWSQQSLSLHIWLPTICSLISQYTRGSSSLPGIMKISGTALH